MFGNPTDAENDADRKAETSVRDGLKMLERLLSWSGVRRVLRRVSLEISNSHKHIVQYYENIGSRSRFENKIARNSTQRK